MSDNLIEDAIEFNCPHCGGAMLITPSSVEQVIECPACHQQATIPATAPIEQPAAAEDQLDHLRITQRATLRRALYRGRSYAIIAAVVCAVAGVQLAISIINAIRARTFGWTSAYVVPLIASVIGAAYFYRRAIALHREAIESARSSDELQSTPDFSSLSDGSQRWRDLDDVR